jgi:indolepyruvate ferredoxin oxidoreductase beta subunit
MIASRSGSFSILVTGVGGQGVVLVSKVIAAAAFENQFFACRTESRGLSQRGGSVCSEIRFGGKELTPVTGTGEDLIIAMDGLEALRANAQIKADGVLLANSGVAVPAHLFRQPDFDEAKKSAFADRIQFELSSKPRSIVLNFQDLIANAGCENCLNSALVGAASAFIPLSNISIRNALAAHVKPATVKENLLAFDIGFRAVQHHAFQFPSLAISA